MNSDELGAKGESKFRELCADSSLVCNAADRDRSGWDFIVDLPSAPQNHLSFDTREGPNSCAIQLKTVLHTTTTVAMPLHIAERLAKRNQPAIICVFKVKGFEFVSAYLIHLLDDRLATILKRLRTESANGTTSLSKKKITFTPLDSERIEFSGAALRIKLEEFCNVAGFSYETKKQQQLQRLGFQDDSRHVRMVIDSANITKLLKVFTGLEEKIAIDQYAESQTRFGITLPTMNPSPVELSMERVPRYKAMLLLLDDDGRVLLDIKSQSTVSPPQFLPYQLVHIKNKLIEIEVVYTGNNFTAKYGGTLQGPRTLGDWKDLGLINIKMTSGTGSFRITAKHFRVPIGLPFKPLRPLDSDVPPWDQLIDDCKRLQSVLKRAGLPKNSRYTLAELFGFRYSVIMLADLIAEKPITHDLEPATVLPPKVADGRGIYGGVLTFGEHTIGFYGLVEYPTLIKGGSSIFFSGIEIKDVSATTQSADDYLLSASSKHHRAQIWHMAAPTYF